jgi:glycosyltransferase involved in cell wall biosynthesis
MISVVILTKNEEENILDCLESVLWCDEIIVVDDYSTDRTIEVIKNFSSGKVKIFQHNLDNNFSNQRNFAISKASYEWILFIDADERVSTDLREEINAVIIDQSHKRDIDGFYIKRKDYIWGKILNHGETGNIKLLRLAKKVKGKWTGEVHEIWEIKGKVAELENRLFHYPHQTISEFLREINFYTTIRATELYESGKKVSLFQIILYPKAKFFVNYFLKLGILDGLEGFVFAILMSFHSFLVRAKLWIYLSKKS